MPPKPAPAKGKTKAEKANPKVRGPSAPTNDKAPIEEIFPDVQDIVPKVPSRPPSVKKEEVPLETEVEAKKLPDMSKCDSAIASLDRMVSRLKERYTACTRQLKEDGREVGWIDSELARFEKKLSELDGQFQLESAEKIAVETSLEQGGSQVMQLKNDQAALLASVQGKMRQLKLNSYRNTPKAIAYRSPHGILPPEIRQGNTVKRCAPAPFTYGRKDAPGTKSMNRPPGGLD